MPAKDLGTKYSCFKCGTKFYDMRKPAPLCPKCGADQRESPAVKAPATERRRAAVRPVDPKVDEVDPLEADLETDEAEADEEADEGSADEDDEP